MQRQTLIISLKPILADFCLHEFETDKFDRLILSRRNDIGKVIYAQLLTSDLPVKRPLAETPATFVIPVTGKNHYILNSRFYYVSKWGEEKINDYVEAEFKRRVRDYFEIGYQKNYSQKQIIESILEKYNIKYNQLNFEAVKKIDYRNRRKFREMVSKDLQHSVCQ